MANYEYKILKIMNTPGHDSRDFTRWEKEMNELGAEGWKIIEIGESSLRWPFVILMREVA